MCVRDCISDAGIWELSFTVNMETKTLKFAAFALLFWFFGSAFKAGSDIGVIKDRVIKELLKTDVNDAEVIKSMEEILENGTWAGINYQDVSRTGFEHRFHLGKMVLLSRAYKTKSSKFYRKKKVRSTIELALRNWVNNDYFCDNWWHNQIGTPNALVSVMLLIGDELPSNLVELAQPIIGRANIDAGGARPGGDRIKIASIEAKNMLFLGEDDRFEEIVRVIEGEIKFVEWIGMKYGYTYRRIKGGLGVNEYNGRGMQYDYSFHHRTDGVNNTLSYGLGYASAFVEWTSYTRGTQYQFTEEKLNQLVDYYLDGICKTAVFGKYPDPGAKNRSISRPGTLRAYNASTAEKLLFSPEYRKEELQEIVDIRKKGMRPTTAHATFFWHSEHFTFQRPDFFTSVRMYSTRTHNMEQPYNSEGLFNHHRGDGTNHISRTGDEYYDIAPVFDYQKVPGATIMQRTELLSPTEIQKIGLTDFVGATTDGRYAAVGFDFKSPHDPLCARKSWFFFDSAYVCLGTGISCTEENQVVTTLNQCLLRDKVTVSIDGSEKILDKGERALKDVNWVFQDGIGYVFPKRTTVNLMNGEATGSWWDINKQTASPKNEVKLDVFKLWIDHGIRPSEATYEYIVVPSTSIDKLKQNKSKEHIKIISNTAEIQAVQHSGLEMIQAVFYKAGAIDIGNNIVIGSNNPGRILVKMEGKTISELTVSDPNRELSEMNISLSVKMESDGVNYKAEWNENKKMSEVSITLPQGVYAGKSVTVDL